MTEQQRVPPGDPRGGQFANSPRPEAETTLDAIYREDEGSFYYPPASTTYGSLLKFWSNVPIPEEALAKFYRGYEASFKDRVLTALDRWEVENPKPHSERAQAQWEQAMLAHRDELAAREPKMYDSWVRPLVRLDRMYTYRGSLYTDERETFLNERFNLPGGPTGTVDELLGLFRTSDYNQVLRQTSVDDHHEMVTQLKKTTAALNKIRSGV